MAKQSIKSPRGPVTKDPTRLIFITASLFLLIALNAPAVERSVTIAELTALSDAVVLAEISTMTGKHIETKHGNAPFIFYQTSAKKVIAGTCPASFELRVPGLISGNTTAMIADAPQLVPGSVAILFIRKAEGKDANVYELVGLSRATLPVLPETKDRVATVSLPISYPTGPGASSVVRVKLSDFMLQVKAIRDNQAKKEIKP